LKRICSLAFVILIGMVASGCHKATATGGSAAGAAGAQGLPVQAATVALQPVEQSSEYMATIKSRRSATITPQVSGMITEILVHSGDHVRAGQELIKIDPRQQEATVEAQRATENQKKALYDYNAVQVERQRKLFEAGVTSRDAYEQAQQAYQNAKADYESAGQLRKTQEEQLRYYTIRAPFAGVVGDIPVHVGDYASPNGAASALTTVDEGKDLEAYIYVPADRAAQVRRGLQVDLMDTAGKLLEKTSIDFVSPEVDATLQGILVKAPVHTPLTELRNAQVIKARIVWSTAPSAVVPVLAVKRLGGQSFVFLAQEENGHTFARQAPVTLGDSSGNTYAVTSGLKPGDRVIVTGIQYLVNNAPVMILPGSSGPPAAKKAN
jgi:RND family efflux transporter MFP subunit